MYHRNDEKIDPSDDADQAQEQESVVDQFNLDTPQNNQSRLKETKQARYTFPNLPTTQNTLLDFQLLSLTSLAAGGLVLRVNPREDNVRTTRRSILILENTIRAVANLVVDPAAANLAKSVSGKLGSAPGQEHDPLECK